MKSELAQFEMSLDQVRGIHCFHALADAELSRVLALTKAHYVKARSSFVLSRDFGGDVIFALSAQLRVIAMSPDANRITLRTVRPGEAVGDAGAILSDAPGGVERLVVDEAGLILAMSRTAFAKLVHEIPELALSVLRSLAIYNRECERRIYELGALGVRARLQAELLRLAQPSSESDTEWLIAPAPTHEVLGGSIGIGGEAVSRHLLQLARKGLVRMTRRSIILLDVSKLSALAVPNDEPAQAPFEHRGADACGEQNTKASKPTDALAEPQLA